MKRRILAVQFAGLFAVLAGRAFAADVPPISLSHAWIVVTTGAPERAALQKAGFRIAPTVNRHDGQREDWGQSCIGVLL